MDSKERAEFIIKQARLTGWPSGTELVSRIDEDIYKAAIEGTHFDPRYRHLSYVELEEWYDNHIIRNDQEEIIGVFDGEDILYDKDDPDMGVPALVVS